MAPKMAPSWPLWAPSSPSRRYVGNLFRSGWLFLALLGPILAHLGHLGPIFQGSGEKQKTLKNLRFLKVFGWSGLCWGPFFARFGSSWRSWAPSWLNLALLGRILSPRWRNIAPRWPNIAHSVAKMRQHSPTWSPHGSKRTPQTSPKPSKPEVF